MRFVRIERLVLTVLVVALVPSVSAVPASAVSGGDYDEFDSVTLNALDGAGAEIPATGGSQQLESVAFDTSTFTLQAGEGEPGGRNSCVEPDATVVYAGRTGWVRFNPGVNGRIDVLAETPGYDSVLIVRTASKVPWGSATIAHLQGLQSCADQTAGAGNETVTGFPVDAGHVYYVQVGGLCAGGPTTCEDPTTPGGSTRIRVTFSPFDTDGDGIPDSADNCEGQGGHVPVTADGCPDADTDGVADAADNCPGVAGVPAPAPYNGCPAGPLPPDPSNTPYVVIQSLDGDLYSTPRRKVKLQLNWPKGTTKALISNRNTKNKTLAVSDSLTWRLRAAKHPVIRGVRVRFRGPHVPDVIVGDTIELDPTAPRVPVAVVLQSDQGWYVGLRAEDQGTGVSSVVLLNAERQPIDDQLVCTMDQCTTGVDVAFTTMFWQPAFVQVTDPAGNVHVQALEKTTAASYNCYGYSLVPYRKPSSDVACVKVGQRCGRLKPRLRWWVSPEVRCRAIDGEHYRVVPL